MAEILEAGLFGLVVLAFTLGLSSVIMSFIHTPENPDDVMEYRVEYGYLGVVGLVTALVLFIAL